MTAFPTLLVVTNPESHEGELYQGELKIDRLTKFLNQYSYKTATYTKRLDFLELTPAAHKQQGLCSKRSANICLLFFTQREVTGLLRDQMRPLLDTFSNDPLTVVWVDKHEERTLHQQFEGGRYHLVAFKPKYRKFVGYKSADFSPEAI